MKGHSLRKAENYCLREMRDECSVSPCLLTYTLCSLGLEITENKETAPKLGTGGYFVHCVGLGGGDRKIFKD